MKHKIRLDVEPLSEARWAKIDGQVLASLEGAGADLPAPTSSRRGRWVVAGVGILSAAAAVALLLQAKPATTWLEPSHIETGRTPSHLALGFATIDVAAESAVTTSGDDARGMLVVLEHGSVDCEVVPRAGRPPFVVQAGDARVRVVGTRFAVHRSSDADVVVTVVHGTVEVARGNEVAVLHDGDRWRSAPKTSVAPTSAPLPPEPPKSEPIGQVSAAPTPSAHKGVTSASDERAYEEAIRNEGKDPEASLATYRRLGAGRGAWAQTALYAAGRLEAERGHAAEARRLLSSYLTRYPGGPNAEDARKLLDTVR